MAHGGRPATARWPTGRRPSADPQASAFASSRGHCAIRSVEPRHGLVGQQPCSGELRGMVGKSILDYALSARLRPNRLRFRAYSRAMSRDQRFYKFIEGNKDRIIRITGAASDKAARYDRTLKQCIIGHTLSDGTGTEYIVECSSRFIPSAIVSQFQVCSWPAAGHRASVGRASSGVTVDLAARMRDRWRATGTYSTATQRDGVRTIARSSQ